MENSKDLFDINDKYLLLYPTEANRLTKFNNFISRFDAGQLYDRKNFDGHITASAIVVNGDDETVLLLEHKKLNRWLQPGGHVDNTDKSVLHAALRELQEEAAISADQVQLVSASDGLPLDIDSHLIPANAKKQEPEHYHHDLRYLFIYTGPKDIFVNADESLSYKWEPFDAVARGDALNTCVKKIRGVDITQYQLII